jgi:leader peptidase (prepilin peptidase)/N-methyltransferase
VESFTPELLGNLPLPLLAVAGALLGAIFGSFINVVIYRLPQGHSLWRQGSRCPACARAIRPWENIPLLSFALLRGRCAGCHAAISWRYPAVEALTAGLFALTVLFRPATPWLLFDAAALGLLLALALIDLDCRLLPDDLTLLLLAGGALAWQRPAGPGSAEAALLGLALGAGFPLLMRWGYEATRGREGLGLGDVKLLGALGALLGPRRVVLILFLSALLGIVSGGLFALSYAALWHRRRQLRGLPSERRDRDRARRRALRLFPIPYGTVIAAATLPVFIWGGGLEQWLGWLGPGEG